MVGPNALTFCLSSCAMAALLITLGCGRERSEAMAPPPPMTSAPPPVASTAAPAAQQPTQWELEPRSGSTVSGTVTLTQQADGVAVAVTLRGAKPGQHGIHFHQVADCTAPDATSAGDHWNPEQHPHGLPPDPQRHMGDLGNITVGADGTARLDTVIRGASLKPGDPHSLLGRALVIHALADNGSQPTGASGAREACAAIKPQ